MTRRGGLMTRPPGSGPFRGGLDRLRGLSGHRTTDRVCPRTARLFAALAVVLLLVTATSAAAATWTGTWNTSYGELKLTEQGSSVTGNYFWAGGPGSLSGTASGQTLSGRFSDPSGTGPLEFTMSADGLSFTGSWSYDSGGNGTWTGTRTTPLPPESEPPPPVAPSEPVADRSGKIPCGPMSIAGRTYRVFARGMTCQEARDILSGRAAGWRCYGSSTSAGKRYLCRRVTTPGKASTNWTFSIPPGGERCSPVQHRGRFWDVYKRGVLCRYARNTTLRALRQESPIVYEFTNPSQGFNGRWGCRQFGTGLGRYGLCYKRVENRLVAWMPSARGR